MSYLPCKNPNCRSYGKPHPNCRCYNEMAEGGDVLFCSQNQAHHPDCQYFLDGGEVIDPNQVIPEKNEENIPPDQVQIDQEPEAEIPADEVILDSDKPEYSPPSSTEDAIERMANSGVLQEKPVQPPEGTPVSDAEFAQAGQNAEHEASVGSLLTGTGGVGLAMKAGQGLADLAGMGKVGSAVIKGAISSGLIQGEDEISKWLLGQGDPSQPVGAALAHIGASSLLGGSLFGVGAGTARALAKIAETKVAGKLASFVAGIASAAQHPEAERTGIDEAVKLLHDKGLQPTGSSIGLYKAGQKAFDEGLSKIPDAIAQGAGAIVGNHIGGTTGAMLASKAASTLYKPISGIVEKIARPAARKFVVPVTMKILSSGNTTGLLDALKHAGDIGSGMDSLTQGVESLIGAGGRAAIKNISGNYGSEAARRDLDEYISNGGINQDIQQQIYDQNAGGEAQGFAQGGEVKKPIKTAETPEIQPLLKENDGVSMHYPEQNILLNTAKGRISNYLSSLRPQENQPKLAFDDHPDIREQKRSYNRALDIANAPLGILKEIHDGTLETDHVKHLNAMYPEVNGLLQKKMTERIIKAQLDGEKPTYKVRQGMSMLMGTALSGEFTPQGIQAAQAVFAQKGAQQQQSQAPTKNKKNTNTLTKSDRSYLTDSQARVTRQQSGK